MGLTYEEIINEIERYRRECRKTKAKYFYIGITNDINRRLFGFHRVPEERHWWIYLRAEDAQTARRVEKYFLKQGMQGGDGGGNDNSKMVYCYEVTESTRER